MTPPLSGGIVMQPGVVLRGGGANSTQLVFHGGNACGGEGGQICFMDSTAYFYGSTSVQPGGSNSATFCGTGTGSSCSNSYTQGSKNLQFSNVGSAGITNGQYLILDQVNDNPSSASSMSSGILICDNSKANDGC